MLSDERIAQLSEYISALYEAGYNYFGYDMPESLERELWDCHTKNGLSRLKVFQKLYSFNMSAYCGRYKNEKWTPAPDEVPEIETMYHCRDGAIHQWHYDLLKLLHCYLYQCCEDATYKTPLYNALEDLEHNYQSYIIASMPEYEAAVWG